MWYSYDGLKILLSFMYAKCGFYNRNRLWVDLEGLNVGLAPWVVL